MTRRFFVRFLTPFLIVQLALPVSAFALRPMTEGAVESEISAGLEEAGEKKEEPAAGNPDPVVAHLLHRKRRARKRWIGYQRQRARQAQMQAAIGRYRGAPPGAAAPSKPAGNPRFRFSPRQWPDFVAISAVHMLRRRGIARIPIKGGEIVLLHRLRPNGKYLLLDFFLKPDGAAPIAGGRMDLSYETLRGFVAKGRGELDLRFSEEAELYLQDAGIYGETAYQLFDKSRYGDQRYSALHVSQEAADALGVPLEVLQGMMALVAVEMLDEMDQPTFQVDLPSDNPFLTALASSAQPDPLPLSSAGRLSVPLGNVKAVLRNRLSSTASGLEEKKEPVSEAELQEAKLRVRYALSLLTDNPALLRWQVAGLSVVKQHPAVGFLDRYLLHFQVDPGGVGSELLAESLRLQHPPADRLTYYGSAEEFGHFKGFAQSRRIDPGERPVEPGTLGFERFLQELLLNLTGLPEEEMFRRLGAIHYPLSRLAADLELITRA